MKLLLNFFSYFLFVLTTTCNPFIINRVILSTDANPLYINFWPLVAQAWTKIGIRPTLALIADETINVDETLGDVIRFKPIPGVSTALHAQVIRLLLPLFFEKDFCILSDIDMIPLNKNYFLASAKDIPDDCFVVYRDGAHSNPFPLCYNAAQGKVFKEIFNISIDDIEKTIKQWQLLGYGWNTDEKILYEYLLAWNDYKTRCIKLGHFVTNRIDRSYWKYDKKLLHDGFYIDAHCLRPYKKYQQQIDELCVIAGLL